MLILYGCLKKISTFLLNIFLSRFLIYKKALKNRCLKLGNFTVWAKLKSTIFVRAIIVAYQVKPGFQIRIRIRIRVDPGFFHLLDPDPDPGFFPGSGSGSRGGKNH